MHEYYKYVFKTKVQVQIVYTYKHSKMARFTQFSLGDDIGGIAELQDDTFLCKCKYNNIHIYVNMYICTYAIRIDTFYRYTYVIKLQMILLLVFSVFFKDFIKKERIFMYYINIYL